MDRNPEEFQSMGIFDIYREAYKVTMSWKKIFSLIALALILPFAVILLAQIEIPALAMNKILSDMQNIDNTQIENPKYISNLLSRFATEMIILNGSKAICWIFTAILSLLSLSAVIYTVACVYYCSKEITFKNVMSAVPKVWKRLMITYLWFLLIIFVFNFIIMFVVTMSVLILIAVCGILSVNYVFVPIIILSIPYIIGSIYISFIWCMASVISILEDIRGIEAIKKGKNLIKGKIWIFICNIILLQICNTGTIFAFNSLVVHGESLAIFIRVSLGICCLVLLVIFIHLGIVIQTIIYFVCKSYHKENIDKPSLADHLDGKSYVPLSKDEENIDAGFSV